ncbi:AAEL010218-PA, partial [Aedes aegypti]
TVALTASLSECLLVAFSLSLTSLVSSCDALASLSIVECSICCRCLAELLLLLLSLCCALACGDTTTGNLKAAAATSYVESVPS